MGGGALDRPRLCRDACLRGAAPGDPPDRAAAYHVATTAESFIGNATPLTMGALAYVALFVPVVIFGRWLETRYAWRRA